MGKNGMLVFYASVRKRYLNLQYLRIFFSKSGSVYLL